MSSHCSVSKRTYIAHFKNLRDQYCSFAYILCIILNYKNFKFNQFIDDIAIDL